ncbi:MAG: T9SS type A sorting domain-containing protein [Candidatus Zixiibacteriota bacterium]
MYRHLLFNLIVISIVFFYFPILCLAQLDEVYDIPLSVHSPDDEWPPWPHIAVDDSGCVYVTCRVNWAIETRKLDSAGNSVWTQIICNGLACAPHDIELDANANVYVLGTTDYVFNDTIMGNCNLVLIKYDSAGVHQWTATYPFNTDIHYPNIHALVGSAENSSIYGRLEVSPNGHSYIWGHRWDRYFDGVHVSRQKNGFLLICDPSGTEIKNQTFECPIGKPSRPGVPGDRVEGVHAIDHQGNVSIVASTWADLEICPYNPEDLDTAYQDAFWLHEASADGSPVFEEQHFRDNIMWGPCMYWGDGTRGVEINCLANDISTDFAGNKYVFGSVDYWYNDDHIYHGFLTKFDPGWNQLWSYDLNKAPYAQYPLYSEIDADSAGNVVIVRYYAENGQRVIRLDPNGNLVGVDGYSAGVARMDDAGNTYVGFNGIRKYDASFNTVWSTWWGLDIYVNEMEVDRQGNIYLAYINWETVGAIAKFEQSATMVIRDAHNDTIPNVEFELIKVSNDPPVYTEDTLGTFTTNDLGQLKLRMVRTDSLLFPAGPGNDTPDKIAIGDTIKVARYVGSQPSFKIPTYTAYNIHIDNGKFDPDGVISFDTVALEKFDVKLNHTEVRVNLRAVVEWEATSGYMANLQDNFRYMSNYMYDVSDGQLRLDTVRIFDNGGWIQADMRIFANNQLLANANAGGMFGPVLERYINVPRKDYSSFANMRNLTDVNPLPLIDNSDDYRTKTHELGHYMLRFYDEYQFLTDTGYSIDHSLRCFAFPLSNYGFMDHHYEHLGEKSSEMSSAYRYELGPCQNTEQWGLNGKSCWDQFEETFEGIWGADNIYAPILKPDADDTLENHHLTATYLFPGPNDDINNLNYDVGSQIVFPHPPEPQANDYKNVHVAVEGLSNPGGVDVELVNNPLTRNENRIEQGQTSDAGRIWVLGAYDPAYSIHASRGRVDQLFNRALSADQFTKTWLYGIAEPDGALDSITISMQEVQGNYPLVCDVGLQEDNFTFDLMVAQLFSEEPSLTIYPDYDSSFSYDFMPGTDGYSKLINDSIGSDGSIDIWAVDDSANQFFFSTKYRVVEIDYSQSIIDFCGYANHSRFILDTTNAGIEKIMVLSSPYPVIFTGLDPNAIQAGESHSVSIYPSLEPTGSSIMIRYSDADLLIGDNKIGDESTLEVYYWQDVTNGWQLVDGSNVDTVRNEVMAPFTKSGTYAAFTTNILTDVEDDEYGDNLPYKFELSQNYPNPFNPVTTIEYSLPQRSHVTIEVYNLLGQKVITLIDYEQIAGNYTIVWDGENDIGVSVATGVYLYRFQTDEYTETKKMLLVK